MKISLIVPVKNEEADIRSFLESLRNQHRRPEEIIIVDGGSVDKTREIINEYKQKGLPIELVVEDSALPGKARNIAAGRARGEIIAMTDAGTVIDQMWLKRLIAPFVADPAVEVVYGTFDCQAQTVFEECFCLVYMPAPKQVGNRRINFPTIVSCAIKKPVWRKISGFREDLRSTEDLIFMQEIKKRNFKIAIAPDAKVHWRPRKNLRETFSLSMQYAICDARSNFHLFRYWKKYSMYLLAALLFYLGLSRPVWLVWLLAGFLLNVLLICSRHWAKFLSVMRKRPSALFWISAVIVTLDLSQLLGFSVGKMKKFSANRNR